MASAFPEKSSTPRLLSRERLKSFSLLPSRFLKEKFLNVKKKVSNGVSFLPRIGPFLPMSGTNEKLPSVLQKQSLFQVSPPELVFENFATQEVSEMVLSLVNKDKFPRPVKVSMERSPHFELMCPNDVFHIVPPGTSSPLRIRFTPDEMKNYCHELVCLTARERIVVPIRAIGARAILHFPDQLDFSECPVKYSTQKTLLVHNIGNLAADYQLSTQSPFSVVPARGTLGAGDTMQVTVEFHPLTIGDHSGSLAVCCNTGEKSIQTNLHGEAVDANIGLSTYSVKIGKTFINTSNYTTMFIENRSNITAHFQWKTFPTEEDENEEKRRQCCLLQPLKEVPPDNFIEEEDTEQEEGSSEDHTALLSYMVQEEMEKVQEDPMLFSDDIFSIEPMVTLMNHGAIDAPFTYIHTTANVGYCFKFAPEEGIIAPGGIQTIQISFNATVAGRFEEEFQFSVAGSPTSAILTIKGRVSEPEPTLHFNVNELDFGDISFGFPSTKTCRLTNPSPVPLSFKLRMSDDGTQPAVSSFDQIRNDSDPSWTEGIHFYVEPREFTMNPRQGTIPPQGHQDIEVTLCSNTVMEFYRTMLVDLEGFGSGVASLSITARCLVPELRVYPHMLLYDECRLKVPYERKFLVVNDTHLPGCYGLVPQKRMEDTPVFYSSPQPCGIVQPHSIAEIPVVLEVQTLGEHRTSVVIGVFGDERNPRSVVLQSTGRLADIYPVPRLIEFGRIPALQPNSQTFTLFNEGLVPRDFRIETVCKPHCYIIEPREGVIPTRGKIPVTITATLDDTGLVADTVQLFIGNSLWTTFMLVAVGTGTKIVTDKPFVPELSLGCQFRYEHYSPKFKPQPPKEKRTSLGYSAFQMRRFKIRNGEEPATALRESWDPAQPLGAEAFSILPQSGVLQPGERQQVSFTFSGHLNTTASVTALCHVEGGPTYEVGLTGEASYLSYSLSQREINCGFQMFNNLHHSTVTLANTGKIEFKWMLNLSIAEQHLPGVFVVNPTIGSIAPGGKQVLKFFYMPGVPGAFSRTFQLKVGGLDPENICLKGETFFPMISVNLPWNIEGNEKYEQLIKHLQQYSQRKKSVEQKKTQTPRTQILKMENVKPRVPDSGIVPNTQLQIKMVTMLIEEAALELQEMLISHLPNSFPDKELCQSLVKVELPEYVLDMGTVRKGYTERRTLMITNPGRMPVSFQVDVSALQGTGFRVNLDQIQSLPHRHTIMLEVCFESAHRSRGDVDVLLPIEVPQLLGQAAGWAQQQMSPAPSTDFSVLLQVAKGPTYNIRLRATVLELSLHLSGQGLEGTVGVQPPSTEDGVDATVAMKKPRNFPAELYSLDFDDPCSYPSKLH
ncbi:hydrocephalus-inducing protein-like isoform 6-T6 [Acridotheres tristis]